MDDIPQFSAAPAGATERAENCECINLTPPSKKSTGDLGEDFVEQLCTLPFGKDFLFRGQMYQTKDGEVELCDLLLLLDDTAVLMEIKTAVREQKEGWTDEQWTEWANKRMEKALSQTERGCNALLTGQVKQVENARQGVVAIDPARLTHVYGVVVVDHPTLDKWGKGPSFSVAGRTISILTTTHEELQQLLIELSTPGDFVDYMRAREAFFAKNLMMGISELDLLAVYKRNPDDFAQFVADYNEMIVEEGCWSEFAKMDARKQLTELDKYSYAIDAMLDILHEGNRAKLPHIEERRAKVGQEAGVRGNYVLIATQLARIRRMDRRVIGNKLLEKSQKCVQQKRDRWFASAPEKSQGPAFVFLVSTRDREQRIRSLEVATWGGKLAMNARLIIGIATEPITGGHGFSVDAFMIDQDQSEDRKMFPPEVLKDLEAQFGAPRRAEDTEFQESPDANSDKLTEG